MVRKLFKLDLLEVLPFEVSFLLTFWSWVFMLNKSEGIEDIGGAGLEAFVLCEELRERTVDIPVADLDDSFVASCVDSFAFIQVNREAHLLDKRVGFDGDLIGIFEELREVEFQALLTLVKMSLQGLKSNIIRLNADYLKLDSNYFQSGVDAWAH